MEKVLTLSQDASTRPPVARLASQNEVALDLAVNPVEAAAAGLARLWREMELDGSPIISRSSKFTQFHRNSVAFLLDKAVAQGARRKRPQLGQIDHWKRLTPPAYSPIAQVPVTGPFFKSNLFREASLSDRHTIIGPVSGWYRYDFTAGWTALAVILLPDDDGEALAVTAIPEGRQDEWLAFLDSLRSIHSSLLSTKRKGRIEILGEGEEVEDHIINTTFEDVILPQETLAAVAAQRRIFTPKVLERLQRKRIPRLRRALLIGPPGTGKTTLLKAEAAHHVKNGGLVFYIFASEQQGRSWRSLLYALRSAADSKLPTLILIEDVEMFIADTENPQRVLNILDGVETPDNPAGTLLLMTTNDADKIDPRLKDRPGRIDSIIHVGGIEDEQLVLRFLKRHLEDDYREDWHAPVAKTFFGQTGSHIQQACLQAAMHALEDDREEILADDLTWAHEAILRGREVAADPEKVAPPSPSTKSKQRQIGFAAPDKKN